MQKWAGSLGFLAASVSFPDNSTFGTYDSAEDNVPYIATEFDAAGIIFPFTFGVGDESEPNDFPDQYRNSPAKFALYFASVRMLLFTPLLPATSVHQMEVAVPLL